VKEAEAKDILAMLKAATGGRPLTQDEDDFWTEALLPLDADAASQAVLGGIREWTRFPAWAQFREAYSAAQKLREPAGEQRYPMPKPSMIPLWVRRWVAARFLYERFGKEQDLRWFPEQAQYVDETTERMPEDAWLEEAKRISEVDVWRAVGR
jgi:hypothetical protein